MCILFLYLKVLSHRWMRGEKKTPLNEDPNHHGYRMILASNRDELWDRPTQPADITGEHPKWIGGMDLEPGREGGTWLGLSMTGKLGVLLNILARQEPDKKGRGKLVTDFITGNQTCDEYLETIATQATQYNPFHLLVLDLSKTSGLQYINNSRTQTEVKTKTLTNAINVCDNSTNLDLPFRKTCEGERLFTHIVEQHSDPTDKDVLVEKLLGLLNDRTQYLPDPQLEKQFSDVGRQTAGEIIEQRSAIYVHTPALKYGTRTNTVILVDKGGNCEYIERTMETPVNEQDTKWKTSSYKFKINDSVF